MNPIDRVFSGAVGAPMAGAPADAGAQAAFAVAWDEAGTRLADVAPDADALVAAIDPPASALLEFAQSASAGLATSLRPLGPEVAGMNHTELMVHLAGRRMERDVADAVLSTTWNFAKSVRQSIDTVMNSK